MDLYSPWQGYDNAHHFVYVPNAFEDLIVGFLAQHGRVPRKFPENDDNLPCVMFMPLVTHNVSPFV